MTANQKLAAEMKTVRRGGAWWVDGCHEPMGPYNTKREADEDRIGVQKYLRHGHRRDFVTCGR